jgi:hypothetical protein
MVKRPVEIAYRITIIPLYLVGVGLRFKLSFHNHMGDNLRLAR